MKLKIVLVSEWFPPNYGGVASHVRDLAKTLSKMGHEVIIVSRKCKFLQREKIQIIPVKSAIPLNSLIVPPNINCLRRLLKLEKADLVHCHHAFTFLPLLSVRVCESLDIPVIVTNHSAYFEDTALTRFLGLPAYPIIQTLNKARLIIAVSSAAAKFIKGLGVRTPIKIIPNAVDDDKFTPWGPRKIRDSINGEPIILYVGRLVFRKGVHLLLEAFSNVVRDFPDAHLVIVGDGPLKLKLRELAVQLSIFNNIIFLDKVNDFILPEIYRSCDIFVLPSIYGESFGIVLLEAMSSGKPVIASNVGGISEIVQRDTGVLVTPGNVDEIAKAMLELLNAPGLRKVMGAKARQFVEKCYSWRVVAHQITSCYEEVLIFENNRLV